MRAAALLALALAGCRDEDELTVINAGAEPALIEIEWDEGGTWTRRHDRFVELPAGGLYHKELGRVYDLEVVIRRKSDGLLLFAADYDAEDLDDDHGHVEITVEP